MPRIRISPRKVSRSNHRLERCDCKGLEQIIDLAFIQRRLQRHEQIGPPHVAIVLRNFVFEDQMISKGVPSQFRQQSVVLVRIAVPVGENQVRIHLTLQLLEEILYLAPAVRQETVPVILENDFLVATGGKQLGSLPSLPGRAVPWR